MNIAEIINTIQRRRNDFSDMQAAGTGDDPPTHSTADVARAIADEYDSLLQEIRGK
jgi:hypothetical protein